MVWRRDPRAGEIHTLKKERDFNKRCCSLKSFSWCLLGVREKIRFGAELCSYCFDCMDHVF